MPSSSSENKLQHIEFSGLAGVRLANDAVEVIASTSAGPRILCYRLLGGRNVFGLAPDAVIRTELGEWRPFGGHRLWIAPEAKPLSYAPDNDPVSVSPGGPRGVTLRQEPHPAVQIAKALAIEIDATGTGVAVRHRLTNTSDVPQYVSAWGITQMAPGGEAIIPQEPFRAHSEYLLPARPLVLWHYTDLSDPRWRIDGRFVRLRPDASRENPQKAGVLNTRGWAGYLVDDLLFVKRFPYVPDATYPDFGCNCEVYAAGDLVEVESLGPLVLLQPRQSVEHIERWELLRGEAARAYLEPPASS